MSLLEASAEASEALLREALPLQSLGICSRKLRASSAATASSTVRVALALIVMGLICDFDPSAELPATHELGRRKRDLPSIIKDASSLAPSDKQTVKNALMNKISTLKESDVAARGVAGSIGGSIGSAVAGGATSAVVGNLLSRKCFHGE